MQYAVTIISLFVAALLPITAHSQVNDAGASSAPASTTTTETGTVDLIPLEDGNYNYIFTDKRGIVTNYLYNEQGQILREDAP